MAKLALLITALFFFFSFTGHAADNLTLSTYQLAHPDAGRLAAVSRLFGIEHRHGTNYEVIVPAEEAELFLALAPRAELLESDSAKALSAKLHSYDLQSLAVAGRYHRFEEVQAWMKDIETAHPELAKVISYGNSGGGKALSALRLSTGSGKSAAMITAATHGDEVITTEVLMGLVDEIVAGSQGVDRIRRVLEKLDLYIIPVVNPDGFIAHNRFEGRFDPNRSYPWPGHENATPTPSIGAVMRLFSGLPIVASIDFHAYGELIMYPWAYTHDSVEATAHARFDALTKNMAEANRYTFGPIADVIYVAPGSSADYYFWKKGSLSLGIEMGSDKAPPPSEFPDYLESQRESTLRFLEGL